MATISQLRAWHQQILVKLGRRNVLLPPIFERFHRITEFYGYCSHRPVLNREIRSIL